MIAKEIAISTLLMVMDNELCSKVSGNVNWVLRVSHTQKYVYCGRAGRMRRRNLMSEFLTVIAEKQIRWYEYTYKKDFLKTVEFFEKRGYIITWV